MMRRFVAAALGAAMWACGDSPSEPMAELPVAPQFYDSYTDSVPPPEWTNLDNFSATGYTVAYFLGTRFTSLAGTDATWATSAAVALSSSVSYGTAQIWGPPAAIADTFAMGMGNRSAKVNDHFWVTPKECGHSGYSQATHNYNRTFFFYVNGSPGSIGVAGRSFTTYPSSQPSQDDCPPEEVREVPTGGEGGGGDSPCGPYAITCECWVEVAWFEWIDGYWTQVSESWWENYCAPGAIRSKDRLEVQAGSRGTEVKIVLLPDAAMDRYGPAQTSIVRNPGVTLIFLRESAASAQNLSTAYRGLLAWEARHPNAKSTVQRPVQISLRQHAPIYAWAEDAITTLRSAPLERVEGLGNQRALVIPRR